MARLTGAFAYQFDFDKEDDLASLYQWYQTIETEAFENYCQRVVCQSIDDNERLEMKITDILEQKNRGIEK